MNHISTFAVLLFTFVLSACGGGGGSPGLPTLESIEINAPRTQLKAGETIELSATGIRSDGRKIFVSVNWSVSDESIGTMSSNRFTAKKSGEVEVIATEVFKKTSPSKLKLTIASSTPTDVDVLGFQSGKTQYATGDTRKLNAVAVHPENSKTPITTLVTWTSSNTNVATFDGSGVFKALTPGSVAITAMWGGFTKIVNIEIKQADSAPILVKCNDQVPISRAIWSAKRRSDPQNGSEWIKFDTDSCTNEFVGLYVRDESKKPQTGGGESKDFFTLLTASKVDGKYQTSVTNRDLTVDDKFLTVGKLQLGSSFLFDPIFESGTVLVD